MTALLSLASSFARQHPLEVVPNAAKNGVEGSNGSPRQPLVPAKIGVDGGSDSIRDDGGGGFGGRKDPACDGAGGDGWEDGVRLRVREAFVRLAEDSFRDRIRDRVTNRL